MLRFIENVVNYLTNFEVKTFKTEMTYNKTTKYLKTKM